MFYSIRKRFSKSHNLLNSATLNVRTILRVSIWAVVIGLVELEVLKGEVSITSLCCYTYGLHETDIPQWR